MQNQEKMDFYAASIMAKADQCVARAGTPVNQP